MEVIAYIQAEQTVQPILEGVVQLVKEILRAREDVRSLPEDIERLVTVVEQLKPVIDKIQAKVPDKEILRSLQMLGKELAAASEKVEEYEKKEKIEKTRPEAWKIAKALFKQGAAKQKKGVAAICEAIRREQGELDKTLMIGTYVIAVDTYATVGSLHSIVEGTQLTVQDAALTAWRIESSVGTLNAKVDQWGSRFPLENREPSIIADLDRWAAECIYNESYHVDLLIAESRTNDFFAPGPEYQNGSLTADTDQQSESRRGAREGGLEVKNSTKVQFGIQVPNDCFLYVLSFEKGLPEATSLELIFPKYKVRKNKLISDRTRKFPDNHRYKSDPKTMVVEKSALLKDGVIGQVRLYVVLSGQPLTPDGSDFNEANIIGQLESNLNSNDASQDLYVERFLFDVQ